MAAGKHVLSRRDHRLVAQAVDAAEEHTGLQICVYLGPSDEDARAQAEGMFVEAGLVSRPAVLLLVAPDHHRVEVVTAPALTERLPDAACQEAVELMVPHFRDERFAEGIVAGVRHLAEVAGPGQGGPDDEELPDVLGR